MSATPSTLLSLPDEILLSVLRYVFVGVKVKVIGPEERKSIHTERAEVFLQRIRTKMKFWTGSKPLKPDVVPLQSALSILQTNKTLNTMGRPIYWDTVVFDLSHWSVHDLTSEATIHQGIPLDKFQHIQLSLHNLPAKGLELFKSTRCLRIESETKDLCSDVNFELGMLLGMEKYQRRNGHFEMDVSLSDAFQRRLRFVVDRKGHFEIIEAGAGLSDMSDHALKLADAVNSITRTSS